MSNTDLINLQYPPGTEVDVLHQVSDWGTKQIQEHWIQGFRIFTPPEKKNDNPYSVEIKKRQKPRSGEVLLVTADSNRPIRKKVTEIRVHDGKTSKSFEEIYGTASGAISLSGVSFESEQDELILGVNLTEQEDEDD